MKFAAVASALVAVLFSLSTVEGRTNKTKKNLTRRCWWVCPSGRECEVQSDGSERCVCVSQCKARHKPVCGTDGQLYDNHCELHRTACMTGDRISVDWEMTCLERIIENKECPKENLTEMRHSILTTFKNELNLNMRITTQNLIDELYFRYNKDSDHMISLSELTNLVTDYVMYPNIKQLADTCKPEQWMKAEDHDKNGFLCKKEFSWSFASKPEVRVPLQSVQSNLGTNLTLQCQTQGYPVPVIRWFKDQNRLFVNDHVTMTAVGDLLLMGLVEEDTGVYVCEASNEKGTDHKNVTLEVQNPITEPSATAVQGGNVFYVFGSEGVYVIDPETSSVVHHISSDTVIEGVTSHICTEGRQRQCNWGGAVNVNSKYIYVADFLGHRVLVLELATRKFIQEISTNDYPYQLKYFRSLDSVWVLCWSNSTLDVLTEDEDDNGTLAVISEASKATVHTSIKAELSDGYTGLVHGFFGAENCALTDIKAKFGYVTHILEPGLHEVDLVAMQYSRYLNLSGEQCYGTFGLALSQPRNYAFVQCYTNEERDMKAQMVVDINRNQVISINSVYFGFPFASPDGQFVVTLNFYAILTQYIDPLGNIHLFPEIKSSLLLSNLAFFPRDTGYDVYVTSKNQGAIIVLHLNPRGVETVKLVSSVGKPLLERDWIHTKRPIVIGCERNVRYLATPATADDAVVIVDGLLREMRGNVKGIKGARTIVWVPGEEV